MSFISEQMTKAALSSLINKMAKEKTLVYAITLENGNPCIAKLDEKDSDPVTIGDVVVMKKTDFENLKNTANRAKFL